jgi:hypothetical protein
MFSGRGSHIFTVHEIIVWEFDETFNAKKESEKYNILIQA